MTYEMGDIVRINGFRERYLFEVVNPTEYNGLYYVTNDGADSELLLPSSLFTLVCRAENREDINVKEEE